MSLIESWKSTGWKDWWFINWLYQLLFGSIIKDIKLTRPILTECLLECIWLVWVIFESQTVQAQGAGYLRSKEHRIQSRQTLPTKNPDCTGSNLFREGIKKRNERMLQDLRSIRMNRNLEPDVRCVWTLMQLMLQTLLLHVHWKTGQLSLTLQLRCYWRSFFFLIEE